MTKETKTTSFAVIETGGKQYKVAAGDTISIEKLSDDTKIGDTVTFDNVLLVDNGSSTTIGAPYIKGSKVSAEVVDQGKGDKVVVVKYRPKSRYYKKNGHRQPFVSVKITDIK